MVIRKFSFFKELGHSKVVGFFFRSWVLAVILGTLIYFQQGYKSQPYLVNLVDASTFLADFTKSRTFYHDIDSDKSSELITISNLSDSSSCMLVRKYQGAILDQWNFEGNYTEDLMKLMLSDLDQDGKSEVSLITLKGNKLLLNIIEPYGLKRVLLKDRLIDTVWTKYEEPYAYLHPGSPVDLDQDGNQDIIFSINSGYARQPRKVYAYDLTRDRFWSTPFNGSGIDELTILDRDQDGHLEITGRNNAPNNYVDEQIEYPDKYSWFFLFDEKLAYKKLPVKMGPAYSQTIPVSLPHKNDIEHYLMVIGYRDTVPFFDWYRIGADYSPVREEFPYGWKFNHLPEYQSASSKKGGLFFNLFGEAVFINAHGKGFVNNDFSKRSNAIEIINPSFGEKEIEYCFLSDGNTRSIEFYSASGKRLCSIKNVSNLSPPVVNWIGKINGRYQFCLSGGNSVQWYEVRKNPWQYAQFGMLLVFILGSYLLIKLIRLSQKSEFARREQLHRELLELQLITVKNQLDPHFAFNALSGLSYLVLEGETHKVSDFINRFSQLFRSQLHSSDKAVVRLRNEIEFLENYMDLQKIRFGDQINFKMVIHPDIDTNILVPKMIIQVHVENALKHGIRPKLLLPGVQSGIVTVSVLPSGSHIIIQIEDDGVGRGNDHMETEENNGKGLQVLEQIYSAVNQLYKMKITQHFEDLKEKDGKPAGTRVNISIAYR